MAFIFKPTGNVGKEISRLGSEQIADAIDRLTGSDDLKRGVHEARKCLKRSRAVLALTQPAMPGKKFQRADKRLRKIARNLARARDAHAMMETVDKLNAAAGRLPAAEALRSEIGARVADVNRRLDGDTLARIVERLHKAQDRFARLKLKNRWETVEEGVTETYRQARRSYRLASKTGEAEAFHEWRKPMQRHWRQMQLFSGLGNSAISSRAEAAQRLSQLLGDDHDLHMLVEAVKSGKTKLATDAERDALLAACATKLNGLREAARREGELLFAARPREFRAMFAAHVETAKPQDAGPDKEADQAKAKDAAPAASGPAAAREPAPVAPAVAAPRPNGNGRSPA